MELSSHPRLNKYLEIFGTIFVWCFIFGSSMLFLNDILPHPHFPDADYAEAYREAHGPGIVESFVDLFSVLFASICAWLIVQGYRSVKHDYARTLKMIKDYVELQNFLYKKAKAEIVKAEDSFSTSDGTAQRILESLNEHDFRS